MMRKTLPIFILFVATLLLPEGANAAIELTDAEIEALSKGELVKQPFEGSGKDGRIAGASFLLIDAPLNEVWRALSDISAWKTIFPNTFESKVVAARGDARAVKMTLGNRLAELHFYLSVKFNKQKWMVDFALNKKKPADIDEAKGNLRLLPQPDNKTLVIFSAIAKVSFGGLIKLMGEKVISWIEARVLSIPKRLERRVHALRAAQVPSDRKDQTP